MNGRFSLPEMLVARGTASTLAQAAAFVMEGMVLVNGMPLLDPRTEVSASDTLALR
ncbi:S4 domain-containing protein [Rhodococcus erythropolis]|uniref:S4 domain-containing protein n=1 Tax=Rhodococcus erythropolis TaxID=1833 RepID=UPI002948F9D9|nr:S4 domain-containing protein [Rhodococcus erythropolis]MDV6277793.1 S4 domain-containing protein [Rhodococcus erythropolis]